MKKKKKKRKNKEFNKMKYVSVADGKRRQNKYVDRLKLQVICGNFCIAMRLLFSNREMNLFFGEIAQWIDLYTLMPIKRTINSNQFFFAVAEWPHIRLCGEKNVHAVRS